MDAPYNREPEKSRKALQAFKLYADMGLDRTLAKVGQKSVKSVTLPCRWSSHRRWGEWAVAYMTNGGFDMDAQAKEGALCKAGKRATAKHYALPSKLLVL